MLAHHAFARASSALAHSAPPPGSLEEPQKWREDMGVPADTKERPGPARPPRGVWSWGTKLRSRPCVRGGAGKAPCAEKASRAGMPPSEVRKGPSSNAESFKSRYYKGASVRRLRYSPRFDAGERGLRGSSQKVRAEEHGLCPTEGGTCPAPPPSRGLGRRVRRERGQCRQACCGTECV